MEKVALATALEVKPLLNALAFRVVVLFIVITDEYLVELVDGVLPLVV